MEVCMTNLAYQEKLSDERWSEKKAQIIQQRGAHCEKCSARNPKQLHLHHNIYIEGKEPWDYDDEYLTLLCKKCHEQIHKNIGEVKYLIVYEDENLNWIKNEFIINQQDVKAERKQTRKMVKKLLNDELKRNRSILIIGITDNGKNLASELFFRISLKRQHRIQSKYIGRESIRIWEINGEG